MVHLALGVTCTDRPVKRSISSALSAPVSGKSDPSACWLKEATPMPLHTRCQEEKDKIVMGLKIDYEKLVQDRKAKKAKLVILRNGMIVKVKPR